jgi:hypothetical protein
MVGVTGFEPAASWSRTKRSTNLSHTPICSVPTFHKAGTALAGMRFHSAADAFEV